jgi:hypothetical protein
LPEKLLLISDGNPGPIRVRWIERVAGKAGRIMTRKAPEIIEVDSQRFDELLQRAESNTLRDEDLELMRQLFASYRGLFQIVGDKNTTIARLRKWMFGAATETSKNILGDSKDASNQSDDDSSDTGDASDSAVDAESSESPGSEADDSSESPPGHGRHGAEDYPGAEQVDVKHPQHSPGDACPECGQGGIPHEK